MHRWLDILKKKGKKLGTDQPLSIYKCACQNVCPFVHLFAQKCPNNKFWNCPFICLFKIVRTTSFELKLPIYLFAKKCPNNKFEFSRSFCCHFTYFKSSSVKTKNSWNCKWKFLSNRIGKWKTKNELVLSSRKCKRKIIQFNFHSLVVVIPKPVKIKNIIDGR